MERPGSARSSSTATTVSTGPQTNRTTPTPPPTGFIDPAAALLGYSQYAAALSGAYPQLPNAFSLFPPPSAMFPGATPCGLPFGGLGSLTDSLLAAGSGLQSAASDSNNDGSATEWWRLASERVQQLAAESTSTANFYAGLAGSLGNSMPSSFFSGGISSSSSASTSNPSPSATSSVHTPRTPSSDRHSADTVLHRRPRVSPTSDQHSTDAGPTDRRPDGSPSLDRHLSAMVSHRQPSGSPAVGSKRSRDSKTRRQEPATNRHSSTNLKNSTATSGLPSAGKLEHSLPNATTSSASGVPSLESSLLSAEAALYASSPLFFPFPLPPLFGASGPQFPFLGSSAGMSNADSLYTPPALAPPPSSISASSEPRVKSRSGSVSSKSSSAASQVAAASPSNRAPNADAALSRRHRAEAGSQREARSRAGKSVIVSPVSSVGLPLSSPTFSENNLSRTPSDRKPKRDHTNISLPPAHSGNSVTHGLESLNHLGVSAHSTPKANNCDSNGHLENVRVSLNSSSLSSCPPISSLPTFNSNAFPDNSEAMDLSVKKPRRTSPPPAHKTAAPKSTPSAVSKSSDIQSSQEHSMADMLASLYNSQQLPAEQLALAQFFASQQVAAAAAASGNGNVSDLSLSLAAAAGLFPPMFDGLSSLFYSPSMFAALAGNSQCAASSPAVSSATSAAPEGSKGRGGRGRGRGGGRRGRSSAMYISNMFQQAAAGFPVEEVKVNRGRGSRGGRPPGRRGRPPSKSLTLADLQMQQQCQYLEQMLQTQSSVKASSSASAAAMAANSQISSAAKDANVAHTRSGTLSNKLLHHRSKLAQALTSAEGAAARASSSAEAMNSDTSSLAALAHHALLSVRETDPTCSASLRTDSGNDGNDETSSVYSSDSEATPGGSEADCLSYGIGDKRKLETQMDGLLVKKRRRTIIDESILRLPLENGWRRETRVRSFTPRKIIGEVLYVTPCDRRLRNYNEVDKFLEKNTSPAASQLCRENFTFSSKVNLGDFYEQSTSTEGSATWKLLTESEVADRFVVIEERKRRIIENKLRAQLREEKRQKSEELLSKLADSRLQRRMEQQELARKVAEMKMRKKAEKEQQREMMQRARQLRVMEVKRMKERQKVARQQERFHRQMQLRMERDLRNQQLIEEKEARRQQDIALKEQYERQQREKLELEESRKQAMVAMAMERERRRLDLLMAKALEARKKEEEKERIKEERKNAKKLDREKKLAQKRLELFLAREQRRPVEDMSLNDSKPLPEFERIPGLRLPGKAFSDCLMVIEFVHNFSAILGFDADSIPTFNVLQGGLLNEDGYVTEFLAFTKRLLKCAVNDPGFNNPKEGCLMSGPKLADYQDVSDDGISEPLRIFIRSRSCNCEDEMSSRLLTTPFQALNATQKAAILAFLCNELLCNKDVNAEIEKNIEAVNNMRRDKFLLELKLKKARAMQAQHQRKLTQQKSATTGSQQTLTAAGTVLPSEDGIPAGAAAAVEAAARAAGDTDDVDSESEPLATVAMATKPNSSLQDSETEDDKKVTTEELEAKIEKLTKQQNNLRERIVTVSNKLSAMSFGHDRYRRQYWVLPKCGGILVEGLESGEPESADPTAPETDQMVAALTAESPERKKAEAKTEVETVYNGEAPTLEKVDVKTENVAEPVECSTETTTVHLGKSEVPILTEEEKRAESMEVKDEIVENGDTIALAKTEPKNGYVRNESFDSYIDAKQNGVTQPNGEWIKSETSSPLKTNSAHNAETMSADSIDKNLTMPTNYSLFQFKDEINAASNFRAEIAESVNDVDVTMMSQSSFSSVGTPGIPVHRSLSLIAAQHGLSFGSLSQIDQTPTPSRVDTPLSDSGLRSQFDVSIADSFMDPSQSSTPSTNLTAMPRVDLALSMLMADGVELPPDFLAVPQNVKPISLAKQRGWWRITNAEVVKELISCLNQRGIRERNLQKSLEKHINFACQSCNKAKKTVLKLEVTEESKRILSTPTSAPPPDDNDAWNFQLQRNIEMRVLEEIEKLEERVCSASLQSKGWKASSPVTCDDSVALISNAQHLLLPNQQYIVTTARTKLLNLERIIERRYLKPPLGRCNQLNLANKSSGSGGAGGNSQDNRSSSSDESDTDDETATRDMSQWRSAVNNSTSAAQLSIFLAQLTRCIAFEKSIMKVLCQICCRDDNEAQLLLCDQCDRGYHTYCIKPKLENIPEGDWYCYECISKVAGEMCCMACGRHGSKLVTCEFCTRRVHYDCLEPPLSRMPKKWCCYSCATEKGKRRKNRPPTNSNTPLKDDATDSPAPGGKDSEERESNGEPSGIDRRLDLEETAGDLEAIARPPVVKEKVERMSKSSRERAERRKERERQRELEMEKQNEEEEGSVLAETNGVDPSRHCNGSSGTICASGTTPSTAPGTPTTTTTAAAAAVVVDDMNVCQAILCEMRDHCDSWPFLTPVNTKQFPSYRKVIQCPIDFQTIGRKLKTNVYKSHSDFAADARLVFSNCEQFNEDDSAVGQAGHSMRQFFESRWAELTAGAETDASSLSS